MKLKVLHTADWHIGQTFHRFERTYEHRLFLDWLLKTLSRESVDVLLLSGDVFDSYNPSAEAIGLFYAFLRDAVKENPGIQIVTIAGNHDSAYRLEAPVPLLEGSRIHLIGAIERQADGTADYEKCIVPLLHQDGTVAAWCLAVPYLRTEVSRPQAEDPEAIDPIDGVTGFYRETCRLVQNRRQEGQALLAMGHFHALHAEVTDLDKQERLVLGGLEGVPVRNFPAEIQYLALGHIHKAQAVGGDTTTCWYAGSPLPMSFTERAYQHQVLVFEIEDGQLSPPAALPVPVSVPLRRIPAEPRPLEEVLQALQALESSADDLPPELYPYLQVMVRLDQPEPALRAKVEKALQDKAVRLTGIQVHYPAATQTSGAEATDTPSLRDLQPLTIFRSMYRKRFQSDPPESLSALFDDVLRSVQQNS
jgi:exonuclease SbcD